jgi:hypothetical protein
MVRLVFRPYTQIWRSICTSEPLQASTRVSSGFTLFRHSSPSFGSHQSCYTSNLLQLLKFGSWCTPKSSHFATFITHPSLTLKYLHDWWTPWSVFQDGSFKTVFNPQCAQSLGLPTPHDILCKQNTKSKKATWEISITKIIYFAPIKTKRLYWRTQLVPLLSLQ